MEFRWVASTTCCAVGAPFPAILCVELAVLLLVGKGCAVQAASEADQRIPSVSWAKLYETWAGR